MSTTYSKIFSIALVATLMFPSGCAHHDDAPSKGSQLGVITDPTTTSPSSSAQPAPAPTTEKAVGDPCTTEGWHPAPYATEAPDTDTPTAIPVPSSHVEQWQLPPGVGYCIPPGYAYPYGYFTTNCATDSDCPSGARCDGLNCRRTCSSDADCKAPMTCPPPAPPPPPSEAETYSGENAPSPAISWCYCTSCPHR